MSNLSRRRFLSISAAAIAAGPGRAANLFQWQGVALGARASITLDHPEAERITARARAEIDRLEDIFSLYRPNSALARLNRDGSLDGAPFELLECLGLCGAVHAATGGAFDPTVQPLWGIYAERAQAGKTPSEREILTVLARVGWKNVRFDGAGVRFVKSGMALTLNGIAQGYVADRVAAMLRAEGLTDVMVNTGELHALGGRPGGGDWPVTLRAGARRIPDAVHLRDRALASSAPLGTRVGENGVGHVLDPTTGKPAGPRWTLVSIAAPSAAFADGLSTAGCLMERRALEQAVDAFAGAEIVYMA